MGRRPELADPSQERHPTRASCMFSDTLYFLTIIGVWKVLGAIAILVPGFARLKEWAYAGIFFDVTGAAASHWAVGDYGAWKPKAVDVQDMCEWVKVSEGGGKWRRKKGLARVHSHRNVQSN